MSKAHISNDTGRGEGGFKHPFPIHDLQQASDANMSKFILEQGTMNEKWGQPGSRRIQ